jgi:hypothetical protein
LVGPSEVRDPEKREEVELLPAEEVEAGFPLEVGMRSTSALAHADEPSGIRTYDHR